MTFSSLFSSTIYIIILLISITFVIDVTTINNIKFKINGGCISKKSKGLF